MGGVLKKIAAFVAATVRSFFGVKEKDSALNTGIKVSSVGLKWSLYYFTDWAIFAFYGFVVAMMKYNDFSFASIFLTLWVLEIIIASAFLCFYKKTGTDITIGENIRRLWDAINKKSKFAGILTVIGLSIKFVFWDGSERASMFFMKETGTTKKKILLLVVVSGTKMSAYTWLFSLGYDVLGIF